MNYKNQQKIWKEDRYENSHNEKCDSPAACINFGF